MTAFTCCCRRCDQVTTPSTSRHTEAQVPADALWYWRSLLEYPGRGRRREWNLHDHRPGRRIEEVGLAHVEGKRDRLADVEVIRDADAGNEGMGVASQVEISLRSQGLDNFHHCFHPVAQRGIGQGQVAGNVFRSNAEDNALAGVRPQ